MSIMIFDTETTSLDKPFCYNVGYVILDETTGELCVQRDFIVEQIWHNLPLFSTAYYADKREIYVRAMRARKCTMDKFGYICRQIARDIKQYNVTGAYAYNSPFDDKVFTFNCDWFHCINPFENTPIFDIRGYAHQFICDEDFKQWCEVYQRFTETKNYSTTAETIYQYVTNNPDFIEEHTALSDSLIEMEILIHCIVRGAEINEHYTAFRSIPRKEKKLFTVKLNGEEVYSKEVDTIRYMKNNNSVSLKG